MKSSSYNFFFPYSESQSIAYNALTNSLALIDKPNLDAFNEFCEHAAPLTEDLTAELRKGAFLIDDFVNERDAIRFNMLRSRFSTEHLGFTIAPTSDCNFRCVYCYEKDVLGISHMTEEVQNKIVEILEGRVNHISSFSVTWYGGEPLLAMDVIEWLSKRFIDICGKNEIHYSAGMITNGYLLTPDVIKRLNELQVTFLQVTIDGPPEIHNRKRPLSDGSDTFGVIMDNLKNGHSLLPTVSLRINVDKHNLSVGDEVYQFLKDNALLDKVTPYYGKVSNDNNCYDQTECLNTCDFSSIEYDYALRISDADKEAVVKYPSYKSNFCGADMLSSYVIDAEGWLYKCWSDIGIADRRVGSLSGEFTSTNDIYYKYMLFDPTEVMPCKDCKLLPICMGGCPFRRISESADNCSNYKYILDKCLTNAVNALKAARKAETSDTCDNCLH